MTTRSLLSTQPSPVLAGLIAIAAGWPFFGCTAPMPDRAARMTRGYIYYLDGAGGGGTLRNFSHGVHQGLLDAGYPGAGEIFNWETGLGLAADQIASVEYKRGKATELARRISGFEQAYPQTPVELIGFSAGTVIVAFALEALPAEVAVDNVVMLSGSLSSDYDLTAALEHVRGHVYVFTSDRDAMLEFLMPLTGTADREPTTHGSIGADGVRVPPHAAPGAPQQYAKVVTIPWNEGFARLGDRGGHFDAVSARFIQAVVAPLIMRDGLPVALPAVKGMVVNPAYVRWADSGVGAWAEWHGEQVIDGVGTPLKLRQTLVARDANRLVVEREFSTTSAAPVLTPLARRLVIPAEIDPSENPATAPQHVRTELPPQPFTIAGQTLTCAGYRLQAAGEFHEWGTGVDATVYTHDAIPGGVVHVDLKTLVNGKPAEFSGAVVEFHAVRPQECVVAPVRPAPG